MRACLDPEELLLPSAGAAAAAASASSRRPLPAVQVDRVGGGLEHDVAHEVLREVEAQQDAAAQRQLQRLP